MRPSSSQGEVEPPPTTLPAADSPAPQSVPDPDPILILITARFESISNHDYERFRAHLAQALAPGDSLEAALVHQILQATARLRRAAQVECDRPLGDLAWMRYQQNAERTWFRAFAELRRLRKPAASTKTRTSTTPTASANSSSEPSSKRPRVTPLVPRDPITQEPSLPRPPETAGLPSTPPNPPSPADDPPHALSQVDWRARIGLDPAISDTWPVILGTTIRAESVMACFEDGWSLAHVTAYYPELNELDLLACRACDAAQLCGPWLHPD